MLFSYHNILMIMMVFGGYTCAVCKLSLVNLITSIFMTYSQDFACTSPRCQTWNPPDPLHREKMGKRWEPGQCGHQVLMVMWIITWHGPTWASSKTGQSDMGPQQWFYISFSLGICTLWVNEGIVIQNWIPRWFDVSIFWMLNIETYRTWTAGDFVWSQTCWS